MGNTVNLFDNLFETAREQSKPSFESNLDKLAADFRKQSSAGMGNWSIPEAYLCLLISAAAADGLLANEETLEIHVLARRSRVLKQLDQSKLAAVNETVRQRLAKNPGGLQEACDSLPGDMRLSVYAHCVDIILSDSEFRPVEEEFLKKLVTMLGLQASEAAVIMQALLIKNRY